MSAAISVIETWIYTQLTDSILLAAIGGTTNVPRSYYYFPPVEAFALIDEAQGAIISYYLGSSGGQGGEGIIWAKQVPDEIAMIDIYSYVKTTLESAFNRIDALFNEQLQAVITGWKIFRIHRVNKVDMHDPQNHIYHRHLEYRFHGIIDAT